MLPRPRRLLKLARRIGPVLLVGVLMGLMVYTHFLAVQRVEMADMIAVKRTSLRFSSLYGVLVFSETGLATRLPGGLPMLAGVALIAR